MNKTAIIAIFFLWSSISSARHAFAQSRNYSLIGVFDTTNFELSYQKKDIPKGFRKHFASVETHKLTLADPEEKWRQFHERYDLPEMHLIVTCKRLRNNIGFVYYEIMVGGIELRSYLHINEYRRGKVIKESVLLLSAEVRDYESLKKCVAAGEYKFLSDK